MQGNQLLRLIIFSYSKKIILLLSPLQILSVMKKNTTLHLLYMLGILIASTWLAPQKLAAQCMTYPIGIHEKEENASIIVLGHPKSQHSYWDENKSRIYTLHIIEVSAYFKGNNGAKEIGVIITGGTVGKEALHVFPRFNIYPENEYIFFLKGDNYQIDHKDLRKKRPNFIQSETYADAQGAITKQFGMYSELHNKTKYDEHAQFARITQFTQQAITTPEGKPFLPRTQMDKILFNLSPTQKNELKIKNPLWKDLISNPSFSLMPITNFTPSTTHGGTVDNANYITIIGSNFGVEDAVFYSNADDGGQTFVGTPYPSDILSWTNSSIEEKVHQNAGTGPIQVNGSTSSNDLQVDWSHNCIYETFAGFAEFTRQRFFLVDMNNLGGYTFTYNSNFNNNSAAKAAFERALETWRCATYVNWQIGTSTTNIGSASNDNVNVITFNSALPAGILGRSFSYYSGVATGVCDEENTIWWTREKDIEFDTPPTTGASWNFGPGGSTLGAATYDFESVALHELGHLHGLGHTIDAANDVMHYVLFNGTDKRDLSTKDIAGGDAKMDYSTDDNEYCFFPSNFNGEMVALTSTSCSLNGGCITINVVITGDSDFCTGESITLDAGTYSMGDSYSWSTNATSQMITVTVGDTYTVTVTDDNDCTGTASFTVTENDPPTPTILGDTSFCVGQSTGFSSNGVYDSYLWSTGETSFGITIDQPGTYTLTVTDANDCTGTDEIVVTEEVPPPPIITGDDGFCPGETIDLFAGSGYQAYLWSTGAITPIITVSIGDTYTVTVTNDNGCTSEDSHIVFAYNSPMPDIQGEVFFCNGESTFLFVDDGFEEYLWSEGAITFGAEISQSGTYTVTVTNNNDCTGTDEIIVVEQPPVKPVITGNLQICTGSTTTLTVNSGFNEYLWSNGSSFNPLNVSEAGTYTVTVTTSNDCTGTAAVTVSIIEELQATIEGDLIICLGESSTLTLSQDYNTYLWSNNSNEPSINVNEAGTYTITVSDDNGCTGTGEATVVLNSLPQVEIEGELSFCEGSATNLFVSNNYAEILWSSEQTSNTISASQAGDYGVTVTDNNGCTAMDAVTVIENASPQANIEGNLSICEGENTLLSVLEDFKKYVWVNGQNSKNIEVSQSGNYTVTVTDDNDCTGTAMATVVVNNLPIVTIEGNANFCIGSETTLSAGNAFESYLWSNNSINSSITVNESGVYTVTATNFNGCSATDEIEVGTIAPPVPNITGDLEFCEGENTTLSVANNFIVIKWSNNSTAASINVETGDTYTVTVTNANACTGTDEVTVTEHPTPQTSIEGEMAFCQGENTVLDAGEGFVEYLWTTGEDTRFITVSEAKNYAVIVSHQNGCTNTVATQTNIYPLPNVSIAGSLSFCEGSNTTLSVSGNFASILWSTDEETSSIVVDEGGSYSVEVTDFNGCKNTASVDVEQTAALTPTITGDLDICEGEFTLLDAGEGYFSHQWSTGESSRIINISESGTYGVTVTDGIGCTGSGEVNLTVNPPIIPVIEGDAEFCLGDETILDAGAGFDTYLWNTGEVSQTIAATTEGLFSVQTTDVNGCSASASINVEVNTAASPIIEGDSQFCLGTSHILTAENGYISYSWSTNETTQSIAITAADTYTVEVMDENGCTAENQITVNTVSANVPTIQGALQFCAEGSTTLEAPFGYEEYLWSTNENTRVITVWESGSYGVLVTDFNGCTASTLVQVEERDKLEVELTGSLTICNGSTTTLEVVGDYVKYEWNTGANSKAIEVGQAGTYTVTVTDANDCTGMVSENISLSDNLDPVISGDLTICNVESTVLDAGGGFDNYLWNNDQTTRTISVDAAGIYSVLITNADGCSGASTVEVTQIPEFVPVILGDLDFCEGESTQLTAEEGFEEYIWSNTDAEISTTIEEAGIYFILVTDENGCTGLNEVAVTVHPAFEVEIMGDLTIEVGESTILDAGTYSDNDQYLWSNGTMEQSIEVSTPDTYGVTVTNANDCSAMNEVTIDLFNSIGETAIFEELSILPNPFSTIATLQFRTYTTQNIAVELFSMEGRKLQNVFEGQTKGNQLQSVAIDGRQLPEGIYLLQLTLENQARVYKRLVVTH